MRIKYSIIAIVSIISLTMGCSSSKAKQGVDTETDRAVSVVDFNADSAYNYVKKQTDFGARVPNTEAHRNTAKYLEETLRSNGANIIVQDMKLTAFDGTILNAKNIIGEYNPDSTRRILLLAHWDSRPWADNDSEPANRKKPVMGANDGASGVGVLLEIARILKANKPNIGIDILLTDAEDWGDSDSTGDTEDTWALGTQYWASNKHREYYRPEYAILLDMVGAKNARFLKDYYSMQYAPSVMNMVWSIAQESGYSGFFINQNGGGITDDHVFVNRAGIPCIDIIDQNGTGGNSGFFHAWHTTHDTMDNISPETLKAVGQTLVNLIYQY